MRSIADLKQGLSAMQTAYVLGKHAGDPSKVSVEEYGLVDLAFFEEVRRREDDDENGA